MQGRRFHDLAAEILRGASEVHWRGAVGRAIYALMLESREALFRWGFKLPPRDNVHSFVRLRFTYAADADLKAVGKVLDKTGRVRNAADYDLSALPSFTNEITAKNVIREVGVAVALLDAIDADPARRASAIVAIQKTFP